MTEVQPPTYTETGCYTAAMDRALLSSLVCAEGVVGDDAMEVSADGSSMTVTVAAGAAFIQGDSVEGQGIYHVVNDSPVTLDISGSDPTDSRIDLIVARVYDSAYEGTEDAWALEVVEGVPGPNPVEPAVPDTALVLARVNIPAEAAVIPANNVIDYRAGYESCSGGGMTDMLVYDTAGNFTFRKADYGGVRSIRVRVVGAGGGGGGAGSTQTSTSSTGGGGGGGGYAESLLQISEVAASTTVTVGKGGTRGNAGVTNGTAGGASAWGSAVRATGGSGGASHTSTGGAVYGPTPGGAGTAGQVQVAGSPADMTVVWRGGSYPMSANGGDSALGGGGRAGPAGGFAGEKGGGGGAAYNNASSVSAQGGNGGDGLVIIEMYR